MGIPLHSPLFRLNIQMHIIPFRANGVFDAMAPTLCASVVVLLKWAGFAFMRKKVCRLLLSFKSFANDKIRWIISWKCLIDIINLWKLFEMKGSAQNGIWTVQGSTVVMLRLERLVEVAIFAANFTPVVLPSCECVCTSICKHEFFSVDFKFNQLNSVMREMKRKESAHAKWDKFVAKHTHTHPQRRVKLCETEFAKLCIALMMPVF